MRKLTLILLSISTISAASSLSGTSVTGSLTFGSDPSNYFDPAYGFVPTTGYLNVSGTTVTISNTAVEFGFNDNSSLISANFTGNQLTIKDYIEQPGSKNNLQMLFTDTALAGQYLIPVSNNFPIDFFSISGDTITLDYPGGNPSVGQTLTATFTIAPIPEPSTTVLFLAAGTLMMCLGPLKRLCHRPRR